MSPEVIKYDSISLKTDMWSVGVLSYVLLSGLSPFLGEDNQVSHIILKLQRRPRLENFVLTFSMIFVTA